MEATSFIVLFRANGTLVIPVRLGVAFNRHLVRRILSIADKIVFHDSFPVTKNHTVVKKAIDTDKETRTRENQKAYSS